MVLLCCIHEIIQAVGVDKYFLEINGQSVSLGGFVLPACAPLLHTEMDQEEFVKTQAAASRL